MKGDSLPMHQHSETTETDFNHFQRWFGLCLGIGSLLGAGNFVLDIREGASSWHLFLEAFIAIVLLAITVYWFLPSSKDKSTKEMSLEPPTTSNSDDTPLRLDFDQQFKRWQFTPSESEIALLLLKGLSFDEIATVRQTKQKTVRQQATSIYRKANVNGRHAFAAWFIEDLI